MPRILDKCCEAIELHGVDSMGIYRLSGTTSRVQRLKAKLDRGEFSLLLNERCVHLLSRHRTDEMVS